MAQPRYKGGLKRLDPSYYEGISYVHWTMTLKAQAKGWLDEPHPRALRDLCFHALAHGHFLFIGYDARANQRAAVRWMRREWNRLLSPLELQHQPFDSVLREKDRAHDAFADLAGYILRNPKRAGLVDRWQDWPYSGALFVGYPKLDPRKPDFWTNFWEAYHKHLRI